MTFPSAAGLRRLAGCCLAGAVLVPAASASYGLAVGASQAALRVDAKGDAQVTWTQDGAHESFVVPHSGPGFHGVLPGSDVSKPANVALPLATTVRSTPGGTLWALQQLDVTGRPPSLDLARWTGAPTALTLTSDGTHLTGTATFHGQPVTGFSQTLSGARMRIYVYLECFGCGGHAGAWSFMLGVAPRADGSFSVALRPAWTGTRYRATVTGPNAGGELAPDAQTVLDT